MGLKNNKARGGDGIPGEAYKAIRTHIAQPIRIVMNKIQLGNELPEQWTRGEIEHIYKNKGRKQECSSYRPIRMARIIYKIWPPLITQRLAQIMHIFANNT